MEIRKKVTQVRFDLEDITEKEMRVFYHMFNWNDEYLLGGEIINNTDNELCPPFETPQEANECFIRLRKKIYQAYFGEPED